MPNVKQIIDGHNKAILKIAGTAQPQKEGGKTCSRRKKDDSPLKGELSRVPSHDNNLRQKRDIHQSHSYSVQGKIRKPSNVI